MIKNAATYPFPAIPDLLSHHAQTSPDRAAILAPGREPLTYGELWKQAREVVCALRGLGIGRTGRVAVVLPNGPEAAVAMVAVAAGSVCVPLNPALTEDEYRRYFEQSHLAALLTSPDASPASRRVAQAMGLPVVEIMPRTDHRAGSFGIGGRRTTRSGDEEFSSSQDDAFLLLTSGSTSWPKTVPLTHASVCLSARNVGDNLRLGPQDRLLNVLPLFHGHGLISGLLASLAASASVVSTPGFDAAKFFDWLTEFQPTWYTAVPAIHQAILAAAPGRPIVKHSSLRLVRSASTSLAPQTLSALETLFGVPVIDTFGMTEAATQITANPLDRRKPGSVGPAAGPEIAILDSQGRHLPAGKRGELALRGPTVTRGYDNDPTATASSFRDGWFRTGDIGYLDDDGYLFIVGRLKEIIHKGAQKVAPAEVEAALLGHPDVVDAAVFAVPHGRLGSDVAAAVVLRRGAIAGVRELRDFAREHLAPFKTPGVIRIVDAIPKGAGGKIKRAELQAAFSHPEAHQIGAGAAPHRSTLAHRLAGAWAEILGSDHVGLEEDVLALGVDSLDMTQMILRIKRDFGVELTFDDIFETPTVAALALRVETSQKRARVSMPPASDLPELTAQTKQYGVKPLSVVQERMLRIERKLPGLPQFNLPFAYRLRGPLDVGALKRSLTRVMRRHASLRTAFGWRKGRPVALVMKENDVKARLTVKDLSLGAPLKNAGIKKLLLLKAKLEVEQKYFKRIATDQAPLFRAFLFRLAAKEHVLLLVFHDIIIDGWSVTIFMEELSEFYSAEIDGAEAPLREAKFQFYDFADWQRRWSSTSAAKRQLVEWKENLKGFSPLFGDPSIGVGDELISRVVARPFQLSSDLAAQLKDLGHDRGVTLFTTLLTAFKSLLSLHSGRTDICVATLMANRAELGRERVIGPFATTTLIRTKIDPNLTFGEALGRVRQAVSQAYDRQELPFDTIADSLAQQAGVSPSLLVQIYFVLQVGFRRPLRLSKIKVQRFGHQEGRTVMPIDRAWLSMTLRETSPGITGLCEYKDELLKTDARLDWVKEYRRFLAKAVANPFAQLGRLADR
ncbi:MAG TPA: AMP-binding protein [Bradyrhizobium sp.]|uniref:AMP-binding protein n=1 Tax=Bradyrhizobium sp. TaxID=376 RepID=UPI002D7FF7F9|nr:AMP-binding protein [Bradyrhizobium sp.]HET7884979.1 AMP-binding protein [Bradyrhizobium sp.]